eukprot:7886270-Ditylum_brightwellii.AAC.1
MLINYRSERALSIWRETDALAFIVAEGVGKVHHRTTTQRPDDGNGKEGTDMETAAVTYANYNDVEEFSYCQVLTQAINKMWVLLDNQSTTDIFYSKELLEITHEVDNFVSAIKNGRVLRTNLRETLKGYNKVWCNVT